MLKLKEKVESVLSLDTGLEQIASRTCLFLSGYTCRFFNAHGFNCFDEFVDKFSGTVGRCKGVCAGEPSPEIRQADEHLFVVVLWCYICCEKKSQKGALHRL